MNNYTWEDWCWDSSIAQITRALHVSFLDFMREIDKFDEDFFCRMCSLALSFSGEDKRNLDWDWDCENSEFWEEEREIQEAEIGFLWDVIVRYIGSNEKYVALIEQAMLAEGKENE